MTLIDSNILIDILGKDPDWWRWSLSQMDEAKLRGPLLINDVIYAEASIRYRTIERFDAALAAADVAVVAIPREALFLAGKTFIRYRDAGGPPPRRSAGFLHRRPRGGSTPITAHARRTPLSQLFSSGGINRAGR